jgi:hypothetical protein
LLALYTEGKPKQPRRGFSMIVGSGKFRYRVNADWAKLPEGWSYPRLAGHRGLEPELLGGEHRWPLDAQVVEFAYYLARLADCPGRSCYACPPNIRFSSAPNIIEEVRCAVDSRRAAAG